ncbi:unnamed protein product [Amoebophrya sp. A25]|nr:unnamed protein product [Amoebophrya sp. A25]|eukprot:GSA25T00006546001.1
MMQQPTTSLASSPMEDLGCGGDFSELVLLDAVPIFQKRVPPSVGYSKHHRAWMSRYEDPETGLRDSHAFRGEKAQHNAREHRTKAFLENRHFSLSNGTNASDRSSQHTYDKQKLQAVYQRIYSDRASRKREMTRSSFGGFFGHQSGASFSPKGGATTTTQMTPRNAFVGTLTVGAGGFSSPASPMNRGTAASAGSPMNKTVTGRAGGGSPMGMAMNNTMASMSQTHMASSSRSFEEFGSTNDDAFFRETMQLRQQEERLARAVRTALPAQSVLPFSLADDRATRQVCGSVSPKSRMRGINGDQLSPVSAGGGSPKNLQYPNEGHGNMRAFASGGFGTTGVFSAGMNNVEGHNIDDVAGDDVVEMQMRETRRQLSVLRAMERSELNPGQELPKLRTGDAAGEVDATQDVFPPKEMKSSLTAGVTQPAQQAGSKQEGKDGAEAQDDDEEEPEDYSIRQMRKVRPLLLSSSPSGRDASKTAAKNATLKSPLGESLSPKIHISGHKYSPAVSPTTGKVSGRLVDSMRA